jgi:hypothetical protein
VRNYNLYWFGMLTTGNVEQVGKLLSELLEGKFYTLITAHPVAYKNPEGVDVRMYVYTSQKLMAAGTRDNKAIVAEVRDGRAHLFIHDTYGAHFIDSDLQGEVAVPDSTFQNPYITFEGNRVTIRHRAPAGNLLIWTFAVEDHSE